MEEERKAGLLAKGGAEKGTKRAGTMISPIQNGVSIELSRREERCSIKGTSFARTINHLRHGPDMGTILCNSS
jgi:hypothetical protein